MKPSRKVQNMASNVPTKIFAKNTINLNDLNFYVMCSSTSSSGAMPNFQYASFPGGPGLPSVSIQMGSIPPGIPVPPGMFGAGQLGSLFGNLMGMIANPKKYKNITIDNSNPVS